MHMCVWDVFERLVLCAAALEDCEVDERCHKDSSVGAGSVCCSEPGSAAAHAGGGLGAHQRSHHWLQRSPAA